MLHLLLVVLLACAPHHFARPPASPLAFPADHGPHADAQTEWWYLQARLRTEEGRNLAVFLASIRHDPAHDRLLGLPVTALGKQILFLFACVADLDTGRRLSTRSRIDGFPLPGRRLEGTGDLFALRAGRWRTWGGGGDLGWSVPTRMGRLDLSTHPTTTPFAVGQGGRVAIGDTDFSYYTQPRVRVEGAFQHGRSEARVSGEGWVDHQYGYIYTDRYQGWLWLAITLDDGTDVLLSKVEPRQVGVETAMLGSVRRPGEDARPVQDVRIDAETTWTGRHGVVYPSTVRATVSDAGLDLTLTPCRPDSEWRVQPVPLWEGPMDDVGTRDGVPVRGTAFAEFLRAGDHPLRPYVRSGTEGDRRDTRRATAAR